MRLCRRASGVRGGFEEGEKYQIAPQGVYRATEASMRERGVVVGVLYGVRGWRRCVEMVWMFVFGGTMVGRMERDVDGTAECVFLWI